LAATRTT
jgi:hypothetical protein